MESEWASWHHSLVRRPDGPIRRRRRWGSNTCGAQTGKPAALQEQGQAHACGCRGPACPSITQFPDWCPFILFILFYLILFILSYSFLSCFFFCFIYVLFSCSMYIMYAYVCMYAYMYVCMYVCMYVFAYACMFVCMYTCMYACAYMIDRSIDR